STLFPYTTLFRSRDEDELGGLAHLPDELVVAADVGLVERRVHLVEQAEGRGFDEEDGEDQRHRGQRLLAARHEVDVLHLLARRLRDDLHAGLGVGLQRIPDELQPRLAPTKEAREDLLESLVDGFEGLEEALLAGGVDAGDRLPE